MAKKAVSYLKFFSYYLRLWQFDNSEISCIVPAQTCNSEMLTYLYRNASYMLTYTLIVLPLSMQSFLSSGFNSSFSAKFFLLLWSSYSSGFWLPITAGLVIDCRLGLPQHFCCGCPISNPRPVLGFSAQTTCSMFFEFFRKVKT